MLATKASPQLSEGSPAVSDGRKDEPQRFAREKFQIFSASPLFLFSHPPAPRIRARTRILPPLKPERLIKGSSARFQYLEVSSE
jgi:hypothetical protein